MVQWDCEVCCEMCPCCQRNKPFKVEAPTLNPVLPPRKALTQWGIDLVNLPMSEGSYKHIVVAIEHLTKWVEARPLKSKMAAEVLNFFKELCSRFRMPKVLISDQGGEFCNKILDSFCEANKIDHHMMAAYHQQANGATEWANQMLKNQLCKMADGKRYNIWPKHLNQILFSLCTHTPRVTKYSPFQLVYGFKARFAINNYLDDSKDGNGDNDDNNQRITAHLASMDAQFESREEEHSTAHTNIKIEQAKQKKAYDNKHTPCPFKKGDVIKLQRTARASRQGEKWFQISLVL